MGEPHQLSDPPEVDFRCTVSSFCANRDTPDLSRKTIHQESKSRESENQQLITLFAHTSSPKRSPNGLGSGKLINGRKSPVDCSSRNIKKLEPGACAPVGRGRPVSRYLVRNVHGFFLLSKMMSRIHFLPRRLLESKFGTKKIIRDES